MVTEDGAIHLDRAAEVSKGQSRSCRRHPPCQHLLDSFSTLI
jgi:hypothetical protein